MNAVKKTVTRKVKFTNTTVTFDTDEKERLIGLMEKVGCDENYSNDEGDTASSLLYALEDAKPRKAKRRS